MTKVLDGCCHTHAKKNKYPRSLPLVDCDTASAASRQHNFSCVYPFCSARDKLQEITKRRELSRITACALSLAHSCFVLFFFLKRDHVPSPNNDTFAFSKKRTYCRRVFSLKEKKRKHISILKAVRTVFAHIAIKFSTVPFTGRHPW